MNNYCNNVIVTDRIKSVKLYNLYINASASVCFFDFLHNDLYLRYRYVIFRNTLKSSLLFEKNIYDELKFFDIFNKRVDLYKKLYEDCFPLWISFIRLINFYKSNKIGFKVELNFMGLGFYIKKLTDNLYKFFFGYSNYTYVFVPEYMKLQYVHSKKKLLLFSIDMGYISSVASVFLLLLGTSVYRLTGIVKLGKIIRLKVGKKR